MLFKVALAVCGERGQEPRHAEHKLSLLLFMVFSHFLLNSLMSKGHHEYTDTPLRIQSLVKNIYTWVFDTT